MALEKFTFNEGTTDNPVVLSQRHISALVAVAQDTNVTKNIKGYATMETGNKIKKYQEYIINNKLPNFHLVNVTVESDIFSLTCTTGTTAVKEGGTSKIIVTGIDMSLLQWEITHSISVTGAVSIDTTTIQNRFHFNQATGDITIDAAQENAAWSDVVTLKAYPSYDTTNYHTVSLTVSAIAVTDAALTFPKTTVGKGETIQYSVTVVPISNTKSAVRYEATANGTGTIDTGLNRYTASTANETATINATFYIGSNYITEHAYSITTSDPVLVIKLKDDIGTEITDETLTVNIKDSDGAVIAENLKNGETCDVAIGNVYTIELNKPNGNESYDTPTYTSTITPTSLSNDVVITYPAKKFGVCVLFKDKSLLTYNQWVGLGKPILHPTTMSPKIAAAYVGIDESWCFKGEMYNGSYISSNSSGSPLSGGRFVDDSGKDISVYYQGSSNLTVGANEAKQINKAVLRVIDSYNNQEGDKAYNCTPNNTAVLFAKNKTIDIDIDYKQGYIGSLKQVYTLIANTSIIKNILNVDIKSGNETSYSSCALYSAGVHALQNRFFINYPNINYGQCAAWEINNFIIIYDLD